MSTVFISYRRENTAGEARALFNDLISRLGEGSVFMDVDSIALGRDFRSVLQETTASCDVMLVLIGRNWADARDDGGRIRLESPTDYVRLEIELALNALDQCGPFSRLVSVKGIKHGIHPENARCRRL